MLGMHYLITKWTIYPRHISFRKMIILVKGNTYTNMWWDMYLVELFNVYHKTCLNLVEEDKMLGYACLHLKSFSPSHDQPYHYLQHLIKWMMGAQRKYSMQALTKE